MFILFFPPSIFWSVIILGSIYPTLHSQIQLSPLAPTSSFVRRTIKSHLPHSLSSLSFLHSRTPSILFQVHSPRSHSISLLFLCLLFASHFFRILLRHLCFFHFTLVLLEELLLCYYRAGERCEVNKNPRIRGRQNVGRRKKNNSRIFQNSLTGLESSCQTLKHPRFFQPYHNLSGLERGRISRA